MAPIRIRSEAAGHSAPDIAVMTEYSSNPDVNRFVTKLVREMRENPYDLNGHGSTIAGVVELACYNFGRKWARSIKITMH